MKARLAVIGCGGLAQNQHIPNIARARQADLCALCDINVEVANNQAERYGVATVETEYRNVLANLDIDGVVIVTNHGTHVPLTLEALAAGKHVYVEKPLAETEEECRRVLDVQQLAGKVVVVGMNRRFAPAYSYAKSLLDKAGGVHCMYYRISSPAGIFGSTEDLAIVENCHIFDILRYFSDSEVTSVYALPVRFNEEQVCLQFASGVAATIFSTGFVGSDMSKEYFEATAEQGAVTVDDFVEACAYSMEGVAPVKRFAGHVHPYRDRIFSPLYKELGSEAMHAMRRHYWEIICEKREFELAGNTDSERWRELQYYEDNNLPLMNYSMDKGWQGAIEHFADLILHGGSNKGATVGDALAAARITQSVIASRESGQVVKI